MPRPKQRTPELRDHVLAVALQLLARDGVGGFTARELAHEADTSTPAVYELFGDKAGLVREVFFAGFRLLREQLDQLVESGDPRADLLALCDCYRTFVTTNPTLLSKEPGDVTGQARVKIPAVNVKLSLDTLIQ